MISTRSRSRRIVAVPLSARLVGLFGPEPEVADHATTYLRLALFGVTPLLVMLAATGVLRGLQDGGGPVFCFADHVDLRRRARAMATTRSPPARWA